MDTSDFNSSIVLLAGGKGTRMGGLLPKQFQKIHNKPVSLYSFEIFTLIPQVSEIIVVAPDEFWPIFKCDHKKIKFAYPGIRRQDSSYHGFLKTSLDSSLVCIHDAARPCLNQSLLEDLFDTAKEYGAAAPGVLSTATLKEAGPENLIVRTIDRSKVWMIQTPQVIRRDWLREGFQHAIENKIEVTDDLQLIEHIGYSAKIIEGSQANLKLTHPDDFELAHSILKEEANA